MKTYAITITVLFAMLLTWGKAPYRVLCRAMTNAQYAELLADMWAKDVSGHASETVDCFTGNDDLDESVLGATYLNLPVIVCRVTLAHASHTTRILCPTQKPDLDAKTAPHCWGSP
jgi:hypothetical protein